jgi:hypothetical protein
LIIAGVACVAVVVPSLARAGTLDQQQLTGAIFSASVQEGQTFTAGLSGALDQVDLNLFKDVAGCVATLEIRAVSGGVPTSTVLASTQVDPTTIATSPGGFVPITFAAPASVSAGTQYAYVLTAPCNTTADRIWSREASSNPSGPYAGGQSFLGPPLEAEPTFDKQFKTYVLVLPQPTLVTPADGSTTTDPTPIFSGVAGRATGDDLTQVTIEIYQGGTVTGTPFQTLTADPNDTTGTYAATLTTPLPNGTYVARTLQDGTNGTGSSNQNIFVVDAPPSTTPSTPGTPSTPPTGPGTPPGPGTPAADTTAPDTSITSESFSRTRDRTPTFTFASNETNVRFECSLDEGAFVPCGATHTLPRLNRGDHTLLVRAIDAAGNIDPTPARADFKVVKRHKKR